MLCYFYRPIFLCSYSCQPCFFLFVFADFLINLPKYIKHTTIFSIPAINCYFFQSFLCPSQCLCKGYAIYCYQTAIDMHSLPLNTTLLFMRYVTSNRTQEPAHDQQSRNTYPNLSLLNMTSSQIIPQILHEFLQLLPNLRVLLLQNASIIDLRWNFFTQMHQLNVLELQGNAIVILTSGCFFGTSEVLFLDLHKMSIHKIQSKSFEGMSSLRLLNLSHNKLEHLSDGIMQGTPSLLIIDLQGNAIKDIDVFMFHGLHIIVYASTPQMCCFVPQTSLCHVTTIRYLLNKTTANTLFSQLR